MRRWIGLLCFVVAVAADARVISYAPYSDRYSFIATQSRLNRHVVVAEGEVTPYIYLVPGPVHAIGPINGQVIVYDTQGLEEPKAVFPPNGTNAVLGTVVVREDANGVPSLLVSSNWTDPQLNPQGRMMFFLSVDGGATWKTLSVSPGQSQLDLITLDHGGPIARNTEAQARIGTSATPFVIASDQNVVAVDRNGSTRVIYTSPSVARLIGANAGNSRFIVNDAGVIRILDLSGSVGTLGVADTQTVEGWIGPSDEAYVWEPSRGLSLFVFNSGKTFIAGNYGASPASGGIGSSFAVPAADFDGGYIVQRASGQPTTLLRYSRANGLKTMWADVTAPEVEALHVSASNTKVLVQVHRPRAIPTQALFYDPALAVWHVGDPLPPSSYDELYLNESYIKGFAHVDVDKIDQGEMFVFDSGPTLMNVGVIVSPPPPSSGGGSEVVQEWGVVKASLAQRLVIPGVARTPGAFGSYWLTDVVFSNPSEAQTSFKVRYVPNGDIQTFAPTEATLTMKAREIRLVGDVLKSLFGLEQGGGALFIEPPVGTGIDASARTYSKSAAGTFGYGMNAIDVYAATSPRFPVSFAGALLGSNFRTNLVLTDVSGRGTHASLVAAGPSGTMGTATQDVSAPAGGQQQINGIGSYFGLDASDTGGLIVRPTSGESIASVFAIDNRTNDPTYFPPDLPAITVRTIPAIGHVDGANGSRFRSDLYMFNPTPTVQTVTLVCSPWDTTQGQKSINFTLIPNEARVIRDVLLAAFGRTGIARLRFQSSSSPGVRITSRTYTVDEQGGTYGFLMPALNSFQTAGTQDTLTILGAINDDQFRTNIGLVDMNQALVGQGSRARIDIVGTNGLLIDTFEVTLGQAPGMQINDLFNARGIKTKGPVILRVSPLVGAMGAYATLLDNGTNDPMYLPANLQAK